MSDERVVIEQSDRATFLTNPEARTYTKRSRIIAVQQTQPFTVMTDRGPMTGEPGDWLVTNHPADDPDSDIWSISADRMSRTYEQVDELDEDVPRSVPRQDPPNLIGNPDMGRGLDGPDPGPAFDPDPVIVHKTGDQHTYTGLVCEVCGQKGLITVSIEPQVSQ
jgi:hypothetical protein